MEPAGLAFGIFGAADICLRYGRSIIAKYKTYKAADTEVGEAILRVQNHWMMVEVQLEILRNLSRPMEKCHQLHLNAMFQSLQVKLQEATVILDGVIGKKEENPKNISFRRLLMRKGRVKRMKLATGVKKSLDGVLAGLQEWHNMLQSSWFLLAVIQNPAADHQLTDQKASESKLVSTLKSLKGVMNPGRENRSIFIRESTLMEGKTPILYSSGETAKECPSGDPVIIDSLIPDPLVNLVSLTKSVRDLARVLSAVESMKSGILACRGVIQVNDPEGKIERFQLVFGVPDPLHTPRSLREILVVGGSYPLDERLQLATQLARSIMFVHTYDYVHKNIRPETIIVFQNDSSTLGLPYLMGFENFQHADEHIFVAGDLKWERDLYRHPTRQGISPEESYKMQHDIYSLGVCLLEIGLWGSFVLPGSETGTFSPGTNLKTPQYLGMNPQGLNPDGIKKELLDMANSQLEDKMGQKYAQVVVLCLSCLEEGDNGFGHEIEFLDEDGILVGVRYMKKILEKLEGILV